MDYIDPGFGFEVNKNVSADNVGQQAAAVGIFAHVERLLQRKAVKDAQAQQQFFGLIRQGCEDGFFQQAVDVGCVGKTAFGDKIEQFQVQGADPAFGKRI